MKVIGMKQRFIRLTACLLALSLLPVFSACSEGLPQDTSTGDTVDTAEPVTDPPAPAEIVLAENKSSGYTIIYSDKEDYGYSTAFYFYRKLREKLKFSMEMSSDKELPADKAGEYEIVIGKADREQSKALRKSLSAGNFAISVSGNSLYLVGKDEESTLNAVNYFIENFAGKTEGFCSVPADLNFDSAKEITPVLTWEKTKISLASGGYVRMITLSTGELMAAYASGNSIKVAKSTDAGKSWEKAITVTKPERTPTNEALSVANANVFELPDGTLIAAYRAHSPSNTKKNFYTSIRFQLSKDGGNTWGERKIIVEYTRSDSNFKGFWEPHMCMLPDGKLAIYYANDYVGTKNDEYPFVSAGQYQHIMVHVYNNETETFGEPIIASNGEKHNSRDGMPVVCRLSDGGLVMVIEANSDKNYVFTTQMLFSEDGINWSDPITVYKPTVSKHYAGAPYVTLLPDGRLAVSCQATQFSGSTTGDSNVHNSTMNVIISKEPITLANCKNVSTESFEKVVINPFAGIPESYAIWPSMCVHGGYLICAADIGTNISGKASGNGLYIRRAPLDSIK